MKHWIKLTAASAVLALGLVTTAPAMIATVEESVPAIGAVVDGFTAEAQTKHRRGESTVSARGPWAFVAGVVTALLLEDAINDIAGYLLGKICDEDHEEHPGCQCESGDSG